MNDYSNFGLERKLKHSVSCYFSAYRMDYRYHYYVLESGEKHSPTNLCYLYISQKSSSTVIKLMSQLG